MSKTSFKISEVTLDLKNDKYIVLYDEEDPRNTDTEKNLVCVIAPSKDIHDQDLQNAAVIKEAKTMLATLLKIKDTLAKQPRNITNEVIKSEINKTLKNVYLKK